MKGVTRGGRAGLVVALAVAATGAVIAVRVTPSGPPPERSSTTATAWLLPRLDGGGTVSLAQFHGHPLVVTFFASWCTACQGELPVFARARTDYAGRVDFAAVDSVETGDGLAMARRFGLTGWPLARDVDGSAESGLHDNLGGIGMPITAFYDAAGNLRHVTQGAETAAQLQSDIATYLGTH